jgi:hypothetical protein
MVYAVPRPNWPDSEIGPLIVLERDRSNFLLSSLDPDVTSSLRMEAPQHGIARCLASETLIAKEGCVARVVRPDVTHGLTLVGGFV